MYSSPEWTTGLGRVETSHDVPDGDEGGKEDREEEEQEQEVGPSGFERSSSAGC